MGNPVLDMMNANKENPDVDRVPVSKEESADISKRSGFESEEEEPKEKTYRTYSSKEVQDVLAAQQKSAEETDNEEDQEEISKEEPVAETKKSKSDVPEETPVKEQVKKREISDEDYSELLFLREQRKLIEADAEGFVAQHVPSLFEKQKNARDILEEEFGKDFALQGYDAEEAKIPGTRSSDYDARKFELYLEEKNRKTRGQEFLQNTNYREKLFKEGMNFINNEVLPKAHELGFTDAQIEKVTEELAPYSENPIMALGIAMITKLQAQNQILSDTQKRLAEEALLEAKRKQNEPSPKSGQSGSIKGSKKRATAQDLLGEWAGMREAR
jgi:hypothetical protein